MNHANAFSLAVIDMIAPQLYFLFIANVDTKMANIAECKIKAWL